uniref:Transmembrane protein n=1 Tax=Zooxanthella nutricula TaxID=1333877 RepID=A0A6U9BZS0_9DINO|mmetsp:Transcript_45831/g.138942  ORF Transcript_45831/g.138942 Transcript_45831/m.138942 type:complete len:234 (+) Transcript_45831:76-777(+)
MGNQFTLGAHDVVIYQIGGCSGGCQANPFTKPAFDPNHIDPKLSQHMSPPEYRRTVEACNEVLRKHSPPGWLWFIPMLLFLANIPIRQLAKPATFECTDPTGCVWQCCGYKGDGCARVTPQEVDFGQECRCRKEGKRWICDGYVEVTGPHVEHASTQWLWALGTVSLGPAFFAVGVYWLVKNCSLGEKMKPAFREWEQKGLNCRYVRPSKHQQACIIVTVTEANIPLVVGTVL